MGANQSAQEPQQEEMETSLYDILGVERSANDAELKKAYKKQALLLHPDRNYDRAEEATAKFAKVQAAYDILSDPQERAWYDSHGSTGKPGADEPEYGGKITKQHELERYLDPGLYVNVASQPDDFYDLVGRLFDQLAREENEAALDSAQDEPLLPSFGNGASVWSTQVKPFYDVWSSFSSIKSFAWESIYRSWDAADRRSRRAMEIQNKKVQDAARSEFNATVRALVKLAKQKDPRVKQQRKTKTKADTSNAKEQSRRHREARQAQAQAYERQEWDKPSEDDATTGNIEDDDSDTIDVYECVVCDKLFKTKKQLSVHEQSKKHLKNLRELQREMRKEGIELGFDQASDESDNGSDAEGESTEKPKKPEAAKQPVAESSDAEPVAKSTEQSDDEEPSEKPSKASTPSKSSEASGEPSIEDLLAQLEGTRLEKSNRSEPKVKGRAKQRRIKKEQTLNEFANTCGVCQSPFASRNKLFEHVKASGHAQIKK